ncbi:MAG: glycosyltransferase [Clostridia bacterium]|nr:glycosyltransferase [Clostridia bacterium]
MKKIFFVIPVYKVEKYLHRCVDSVISQTYDNTAIILVDDGSPDNCPGICDDYARRYDNIKVIHKQNGGLSDARNVGIEYVRQIAAADDYITFLDSDDYVSKDFSKTLITLCEENGCDLAQCDYEKGSGESFSDTVIKSSIVFKSGEDMLLDQRLKSQSWAKIYKLHTFDNVLFPLKVLNEDEFTTYRAVYKAERVALINKKFYYYYQHPGSIMDDIAKRLKNNPHLFDWLDAYKERIRFFEQESKPQQIMRTHEKICTDVILRYCEQMYLKKNDRDEALVNGEYIRIYREHYKLMRGRKGISLKRRLMYMMFYIMPYSAVLPGKLLGLRK